MRPSHAEPSAQRAPTPKQSRRITENDEFAAFFRRILRAYSRRVAVGDIDALAGLAAMASELDAAIQYGVNGLRDAGYSWAEIAAQLGITRQGAQQRWNGKNRVQAGDD
jgi:hypothetical protein